MSLVDAGCTFISLVVDTTVDSFSLGNMGDSTFYLVTETVKESKEEEEKEYKIELINELDTPDNPQEAKRILAEGGVITKFPNCSRLGPSSGAVAMSAGFGDKKIKALRGTFKTKTGIPYPPNSYGIFACDGLREYFSEDEIKAFLVNHIKEAKGEATPQSAARDLTMEAFRKGSTDNISTMVIDFNKLKALNPGKIIQLAIADGHGPKADKISHAACAVLKPRQAPAQIITERREYPFDHGRQCLPMDKLAVHKRHKKFNKEEHGWLSGEQFIALWTQKIPDFHTWYHIISPSTHRFKVEISQLFYAYCYEKWFKGLLEEDTENQKLKDNILAALNQLRQIPESERLAKEWLKAYFKREKILAALDHKDNYSGLNDPETDYDTDSSQEEDEEKLPRIDRDIELATLFPKPLPSPGDSKLSVRAWEEVRSPSDTISSDAIPEFLNTCMIQLPELLSGDRELAPIMIEIKAGNEKLTLRQQCETIFKLIDKAYQLKIKSVNSSSFLAHSSLLSKVCNCLHEISVDSPLKFYRSLSSINSTIQGLYFRHTPQQAIQEQETIHTEF